MLQLNIRIAMRALRDESSMASFAGVRLLLRAFIIAGRNSSLRPASAGLLSTRRGQQQGHDPSKEARDLTEVVAEQALELRLLKKA
jgi:hypothetical protein